MINASELRIGNLVYLMPEKDRDKQIIFVDAKTLVLIDEQTEDYRVSGIPITDEWLLRCGYSFNAELKVFGATYQNPHYTNYSDWYIFKDNDGDYKIKFMRSDGFFDESVFYFKYLHHLQNIFFTLTGEELPIK